MVNEQKLKEAFKRIKQDIEDLHKKISMVAEILQEKHDIEFKSLQAEIASLKKELSSLKNSKNEKKAPSKKEKKTTKTSKKSSKKN